MGVTDFMFASSLGYQFVLRAVQLFLVVLVGKNSSTIPAFLFIGYPPRARSFLYHEEYITEYKTSTTEGKTYRKGQKKTFVPSLHEVVNMHFACIRSSWGVFMWHVKM